MMVAVVEYGYYSICKAKKKKGRWFIRDGCADGKFVKDSQVKLISSLSDKQKDQIVKRFKKWRIEKMNFAFAKDESLREYKDQWMEALDKMTFEDVLKEEAQLCGEKI